MDFGTAARKRLPSVFARIGSKPLASKPDLPNPGTETGAGGEVGALIDAPFEESIMTTEGILYFRSSVYFGNLLAKVQEFVRTHPAVVLDFLDAVEHRKTTPGFPEFPLGENAFERVIETIFKDEPTEDALIAAGSLVPCNEQEFQTMRKAHPELLTYLEKTAAVLARLSLTRPDVIRAFLRNIHRVRNEMLEYVSALHIEYVERRDDVPF